MTFTDSLGDDEDQTDAVECGARGGWSPVERTCTEIALGRVEDASGIGPKPLSAYRSVPAYVLLGDPGSGKTTEFRTERRELGDVAAYVKARDFIRLDLDSRPEWRERTLFIDGLDEMRAGATDARLPLDEIRNRLDRLGRPRFRLSCRESDWLGPNDRQSLEAVSPDSTVRVLLLDQLSPKAVRELLAEEIGIDDADLFANEAEHRGLGAMLRNPQTLHLLTKAVGPGGTWPGSRLETLDLACRKLATEHNEEHRYAGANHPAEAILDVAGHLCALLLLCGFEGYELAPGDLATHSRPRGLVQLDDLGNTPLVPPREVLKAALATNVFEPDGETVRVPSHRLIAEFLAGRYLAQLIDQGLPARRVVALMTGPSDGRVVTGLRGLSAWLAAHPGEARSQLIEADPVGVGLYGDIGGFTPHDRERLLRSLVEFAAQGPLFGHAWQDDRALGYGVDTARAFRSLASADMSESIRSVLRTPVGQRHRDRTTAFVLDVLSEAEESEKKSLISLVPDVMTIMRDPNGPPWVTARALDAYIRIAPPGKLSEQALVDLLNAIRDGLMPDPDEGMRVALLDHLFPSVIGAAEVWRCGLPRPGHNSIGGLSSFWRLRVLPKSSDECIAELLDALSEDAQHLVPALAHSYLDDLPVQLLARGLRAFGETPDMHRLFGWLDAAGHTRRAHRRNEDDARFVRGWLENRPDVQKQVFLLWLRPRVASDPEVLNHYQFCDPLQRSRLPGGFGLWCLDQAMALERSEPAPARALLDQAYRALADPAIRERLTLAVMRDRVGTGLLANRLAELESRGPTDAEMDAETERWRREIDERREKFDEEERQRQQSWQEGLRSQLDDLRGNRFHAPDLHTLAQVYLGMFADVDSDAPPRQRVHDFIGGDEALVKAVLAAIREAVFRDDVPTVGETIALHAESRHSWLAYPVLASVDLLDEENPARFHDLGDDRRREALAILYCVPSDREHARWHERWFQEMPELSLDVLCACAASQLRAGAEVVSPLNTLNSLAGDEDSGSLQIDPDGTFTSSPPKGPTGHEGLVHAARLRLMGAFPTRASNKQMGLLDDLLARAMQHPDSASLRALAARKSSLTSMTVAQRVRWLGVDALLSTDPSLQPVKEYVNAKNTEVRVRHFAEFLRRTSRHDDMRRSVLADAREPDVLRDAIEILGPSFAPTEWGGWITLGMEMSELVARLIAQLGTMAGDETEHAFEDLIKNPRLELWRDRITEARERHRVINRDASYRHHGIDEVQRTLGRDAPANAADLAALLQDRIADIATDVRGGNDNPWRSYWSDDRYRPPTEPKHEDSCRDALLTDLKKRLPVEVDAAPEGRYAADNRADIRANCNGFNVPVEIKKNSHRDLWSAPRRQLIAKYTTDPATSGYGIYLVLWFGVQKTQAPPDGKRPETPEELRQRLEDQLTPDEARKISVIVMDVTKPGEPRQ
jgi:hypothetical protein